MLETLREILLARTLAEGCAVAATTPPEAVLLIDADPQRNLSVPNSTNNDHNTPCLSVHTTSVNLILVRFCFSY